MSTKNKQYNRIQIRTIKYKIQIIYTTDKVNAQYNNYANIKYNSCITYPLNNSALTATLLRPENLGWGRDLPSFYVNSLLRVNYMYSMSCQ